MPCPHGIGDCSSICHLRTISPFRQRSDKTFIVGGLDSERPPYPDRFSSRHWHVFRVLSFVVLTQTLISLAFGGLGCPRLAPSRRRQHVTYLQIIRVRNRSCEKGTNRGDVWPNQVHFRRLFLLLCTVSVNLSSEPLNVCPEWSDDQSRSFFFY
jgi:hypothetical protein